MAEKQARIVVRGRVQGVFFRASLLQQAQLRGLHGWVRNRFDGAVEALIQGESDAVDRVIDWARMGPRGAVVDSVDVAWFEPESSLPGFEIRDQEARPPTLQE